jgi:hypothetical protein
MKTAGEYKFIENGCHKTYCCCLNVKTGVNVNGAWVPILILETDAKQTNTLSCLKCYFVHKSASKEKDLKEKKKFKP